MTGIGIVEARRRAGVGQRELALALGTSPQRLSDIERGTPPSPTASRQGSGAHWWASCVGGSTLSSGAGDDNAERPASQGWPPRGNPTGGA